jgi:DNA-binding NarL/FixJ family response regulator
LADSNNVLVVEDDETDRNELAAIVTGAGLVPHCAKSAKTARALLAKGLDWRAMTFDVGLPDGDGLHVLAEARKAYPDVAALVLTGIPKTELANTAYDLHARCVFKSRDNRPRLEAFLEEALAGGSLKADPLWLACDPWGRKHGLTTAERDIFFRRAEGATELEIAEARGTTKDTIEGQAKAIFKKTGDRTLWEAVTRCLREKIRDGWTWGPESRRPPPVVLPARLSYEGAGGRRTKSMFSDQVITEAWTRAGSARCECCRDEHANHEKKGLCRARLVWDRQGLQGLGAWDARRMGSGKDWGLSDCEIVCWECLRQIGSVGAASRP